MKSRQKILNSKCWTIKIEIEGSYNDLLITLITSGANVYNVVCNSGGLVTRGKVGVLDSTTTWRGVPYFI